MSKKQGSATSGGHVSNAPLDNHGFDIDKRDVRDEELRSENEPVAGLSQPAANGKVVESKRQRFLRLIPKRMQAAIKRIRHVANLSNRQSYEFTDDESAKIARSIAKELAALEAKFSGSKASEESWTL